MLWRVQVLRRFEYKKYNTKDIQINGTPTTNCGLILQNGQVVNLQ